MEQATTSARVVSVTREQGGVALIHLNRPPANSYDRQFIDDLNAAIDEIRFDEAIGAVVLMSDLPKFFSAGADIGMFRSVTPKARAMTILHMHEVLLKMEHTPKVFIAAIGGHCPRRSHSRPPWRAVPERPSERSSSSRSRDSRCRWKARWRWSGKASSVCSRPPMPRRGLPPSPKSASPAGRANSDSCARWTP